MLQDIILIEKEVFVQRNEEASRKASEQKLEELDKITNLSRKLDEGIYGKIGGNEEYKKDVANIVLNFIDCKVLGVKVGIKHLRMKHYYTIYYSSY